MSKIDKDDVKMNHEALIGKVGVVSEKITKNNLSGRVKVGGDDWRALSEDGEEIEINEQVVVLKIDSIQLVVKKNN